MADAALAATQAIPFTIGAVLAERYELRALLGEGGMGAVFRAYDRELDEEIALKVLHADIASDVAALTRFRREVKLARRVTHRNVARTFDLGTHAGMRFLTMELIVGESLGARKARARLHLPDVLRIAAEIARGLSAAHVVGVVHRDLKPENVMLSDERVVLTDFGIARVADGSADVMRTGMIVGTPAYMAPEQLENGPIDGRTDVHALGTMLFELLANRLPFSGDTPISVAAQRLTGDAPDVRTVDATVPEHVAILVHEMLARRREDRPDAQGVLDRVEALRGNAASGGRGMSRLATLTMESVALLGQPRTVAIEPIAGELGPVLTSALVDAIAETRIARVVTGRDVADLAVHGTLHASGERVRARLRVVERTGTPAWAGHIDGTIANTLDFEDAVVAAVVEALRARTAADPGPRDPALRDVYDKAGVELSAFVLPRVRVAVTLLEEVEAKHPGDPRIRTRLARALQAVYGQTGARDRSVQARAEELALRALETEPALADAHNVIAQVRLADGELIAWLRAAQECLRYDPRCGGAHASIGSMLCESLHVREGLRRIELATRIEPESSYIAFSRMWAYGMLGDRDKVRAVLDAWAVRGGPLAPVVAMTRIAVWWRDLEMADRARTLITEAKAGASWDQAAIIMSSVIDGKMDPNAPTTFERLTSREVAPRQRVMMNEVAAEYFAIVNEPDLALKHVAASAALPMTNLLWLDACEPLSLVRNDPRFSEARAVVAARCADLWGSVGSWPNE